MIELNFKNDEIVSSPTTIVAGQTSSLKTGVICFVNNSNKVFPPQYAEINNGQFKIMVHVSPGEANNFDIQVLDNTHLSGLGFPAAQGKVVDSDFLRLHFHALPENKPVHLCVVVGRDSNGSYDMPSYKTKRGEVASLNTAIQRLKVAGRMMQAFTQDEFKRVGLSNRSFQFVEETNSHQGIFGYDVQSAVPHQEVKVHVLRSPKTVAELRDPNLAQQNPDAKDNGGLFSHAIDLIRQSPLYELYGQSQTAIQCAVMYLDSHWNQKYILTHAALGGGTGEVKLAIFGSHGLHSYPLTFPGVNPSFLDDTHLTTKEVANDCNECGTSWECLNICMGAFMHEIGHLFGSPHQTDGVMLRDYVWWNRLFMTREAESLREQSKSKVIGPNGSWPRYCHWNIRDLIRYLYHDSFSIPVDQADNTFPKSYSTTMRSDHSYADSEIPQLAVVGEGTLNVKSLSGVFMIEVCGKDLARFHIVYYPGSYGGRGLQHDMTLHYEELLNFYKNSWNQADDNFDVRILSPAGDLWLPNFKDRVMNIKNKIIKDDFGLGRGQIEGIMSDLNGSDKGEMKYIGFDVKKITKIRVFHGGALDGVRFYLDISSNDGRPPPLPKRGYLDKFMSKLAIDDRSSDRYVTLGNEKPHYTDFVLNAGEYVTLFSIRNGQWIDAFQVETNLGRKSEMLGNAGGGHLSVMKPPTAAHQIVGLYGYTGRWMDGLGFIYAAL